MPMIGDRPEMNLKTVVYATDFSLCSQNAGLYAARIASYFSATLLITHAFTLSQAALEVEINKTRVSQQRKDLETLLSRSALLWERNRSKPIPFFWREIRKTSSLHWPITTRQPSLCWEHTEGVGSNEGLLALSRKRSFALPSGQHSPLAHRSSPSLHRPFPLLEFSSPRTLLWRLPTRQSMRLPLRNCLGPRLMYSM